jgi:glycosyltransferase involved in cell wall biosynthesis
LKRAGTLQFQTVIVGEGGEAGALRARCAELGIENYVRLVGSRSHDEIGDWMRVASVFCLPSVNEGMPNVLIEAQACGVPIVASNVGGIPEIVASHTGLLVPAANPTALAHALTDAVTKNWDRQKVAEHVAWADWNSTAKQYADLIRSIGSRTCNRER